jgi:altronate hydrolase
MTAPVLRPRVLHLGADDDVAIALEPLAKGTPVDDVVAVDDIPSGHKIALRDLPAGALVHK